MKVLIVYSDLKCSCTKKNTFELSQSLSKYRETNILFYTHLTEEHFIKYNIIVFQRLGGNGANISQNFLKNIKNLINRHKDQMRTVYNIDDLLINPITTEFMSIVDLVLVPNISYNKYVTTYNKNIAYSSTFIDNITFDKVKKINLPSCLNFMWSSTAMLGVEFMKKLIPQINKNFPASKIYIIGGENRLPKSENVIFLPILDYEKYLSYFKAVDIYLNPIEITQKYHRGNVDYQDFINCKSELKYVHAGLASVPIISSKSYPYEKAIKNRWNGFILDNDENIWINTIKEILINKNLRNFIIKNAYDDVMANYTADVFANRVYNIYKNIKIERKFIPKEISKAVLTSTQDKNISPTGSGDFTVGEFFRNKKIITEFVCPIENLQKLSFFGATYKRDNNKGIIKLTLSFEEKIIRTSEVDVAYLKDNSWFDFNFENIINSKNKKYTLLLESNSVPLKSITIYCSKDPRYVLNCKKIEVIQGSNKRQLDAYLIFDAN